MHKWRMYLPLCIILSGFVLLQNLPVFGQEGTNLPTEETNFVTWHPGGTMLVVTENDEVRIIDVAAPSTPIRIFQLQGKKLYTSPVWSPDGERLAFGNGSSLEIWEHPWDNSQTQPLAVLIFEEPSWGAISACAWSLNGQYIAAASGPITKIWDTSNWISLYTADGQDIEKDMVWSPDGTKIADAVRGGDIGVLDTQTYQLIIGLILADVPFSDANVYRPVPTSIVWSPDGQYLVIGADDGRLRILNTTLTDHIFRIEDDTVTKLTAHTDGIRKIVWRPHSMELASGSRDGTIKVWDMETLELRETIAIPRLGSLWSFAWSPDGTRLAYREPGNAAPTIVQVPPPNNWFPNVNAGLDQNLTDNDSSGLEQVTLDGSGSSDSDGTIVSYSWSEDGVEIATGVNPQVNFNVGVHTILLTVTDDDGTTDTDEVVITVNPGATGATISITVPSTDGTILATQDDTRFQAVAAMCHEFGVRYMLYQIAYTFAVAWLGAPVSNGLLP